MNSKLIIAAAALAVSMGSASSFSNASPLGLCATGNSCVAQPGYMALGRVKPAPKALGRVVIPVEPAACVRAREAIKSNLPKATLLVKICLAQGGNVDSSPAVLPPIVISQPVPAPAPLPAPTPKPSGSAIDVNVDLGGGYGGGYDNGYNDGISCGEGRSIVRHSGFSKVHVMDCSSDVFAYSAKKQGQLFKVFVNGDGNIVHVSNFTY